jgi:hypothetical protein
MEMSFIQFFYFLILISINEYLSNLYIINAIIALMHYTIMFQLTDKLERNMFNIVEILHLYSYHNNKYTIIINNSIIIQIKPFIYLIRIPHK